MTIEEYFKNLSEPQQCEYIKKSLVEKFDNLTLNGVLKYAEFMNSLVHEQDFFIEI